MAFGFKNNKEKASIRTVTLKDPTTSTYDRQVNFDFPIDDDEIILAVMCSCGIDEYNWHYMSRLGEHEFTDSVKIERVNHDIVSNLVYVACYVQGTPSADNDVTIKAVLMKID